MTDNIAEAIKSVTGLERRVSVEEPEAGDAYETMVHTPDPASCRGVYAELLLESVSTTRDQCRGTAYRPWG